MKNLVYFTVGCDPNYASLLKVCIASLRASSDMSNTDILVICDQSYVQHIKELHTHVHVVNQEVRSGVEASMQKVRVFEWPHIMDYAKVVYLDCDIVICKDIACIFDGITDVGTLYTCPEKDFKNPHESLFFSLQEYTADELSTLNARGVYGFNCGQFGFCVDAIMKGHFEDVCKSMNEGLAAGKRFFYEQSFMNVHFNNLGRRDDELFYKVTNLTPWNMDVHDGIVIAHFANASISWPSKLRSMLALGNKLGFGFSV